MYSDSATLSGTGLSDTEGPHRLSTAAQLPSQGRTAFPGRRFDLVNNDQFFWFWINRSQPPAVYVCRHDQFPTSRARQMIPVDPDWLIEARARSEINPSLPHQGPYPDPNKGNRIFIRTVLQTPEGPNMKYDHRCGDALVMGAADVRRPRAAASPLDGRGILPRSADGFVRSHGRAGGMSRGPIQRLRVYWCGAGQSLAGQPGRVVEHAQLSRFAGGSTWATRTCPRPAAGDGGGAERAAEGRCGKRTMTASMIAQQLIEGRYKLRNTSHASITARNRLPSGPCYLSVRSLAVTGLEFGGDSRNAGGP